MLLFLATFLEFILRRAKKILEQTNTEQSLRKLVSDLSGQVRTFEDSEASVKKQLVAAQKQLQIFQEKVVLSPNKAASIEELQRSKTVLEKEVQLLISQTTDAEKTEADLKAQLRQAEDRFRQLDLNFKNLDSTLTETKEQYKALKQSELTQELEVVRLKRFEKRSEELQDMLQRAQTEAGDLQKQLNQSKSDVAAMEKQAAAAKRAQESETREMQEHIDRLERNLKAAHTKLMTLETDKSKAAELLIEREKELRRHQRQLSSVQDELESARLGEANQRREEERKKREEDRKKRLEEEERQMEEEKKKRTAERARRQKEQEDALAAEEAARQKARAERLVFSYFGCAVCSFQPLLSLFTPRESLRLAKEAEEQAEREEQKKKAEERRVAREKEREQQREQALAELRTQKPSVSPEARSASPDDDLLSKLSSGIDTDVLNALEVAESIIDPLFQDQKVFAVLRVYKDKTLVDTCPLVEGVNVIGRVPPPGGVALNYACLSRTHAQIECRKDGCSVMDLKSTNKTRLLATLDGTPEPPLPPSKAVPLANKTCLVLGGELRAQFFLRDSDKEEAESLEADRISSVPVVCSISSFL
jgi:hypothetical protein